MLGENLTEKFDILEVSRKEDILLEKIHNVDDDLLGEEIHNEEIIVVGILIEKNVILVERQSHINITNNLFHNKILQSQYVGDLEEVVEDLEYYFVNK